MMAFTMVQMFYHDDQYDGGNMTLGLWDALHGVKVRKQRSLSSFCSLTLRGTEDMERFRTNQGQRCQF